MAEQFSRPDGTLEGARDMSWSYGACLSMTDRREKRVPASWGAAEASRSLPPTCSVETFKGTYEAAGEIKWPKFPCKPVEKVQITFNVHVSGTDKDHVHVGGHIPELGSWVAVDSVDMDEPRWDIQSQTWLWSAAVDIPAGTQFTYRYKKFGGDGAETRDYSFQVANDTCWYADATDDAWVPLVNKTTTAV